MRNRKSNSLVLAVGAMVLLLAAVGCKQNHEHGGKEHAEHGGKEHGGAATP